MNTQSEKRDYVDIDDDDLQGSSELEMALGLGDGVARRVANHMAWFDHGRDELPYIMPESTGLGFPSPPWSGTPLTNAPQHSTQQHPQQSTQQSPQQYTQQDLDDYEKNHPVDPGTATHSVHTGWGTGTKGAEQNVRALTEAMGEEGVPHGEVSSLSDPNPTKILALYAGAQTKMSRAIADKNVQAVRESRLHVNHPHSQGVAQTERGMERAIQLLTKEDAPHFSRLAQQRAQPGTVRETRINDDDPQEFRPQIVRRPETRKEAVDRTQSQLARQHAIRRLNHHTVTVATGASRGSHRDLDSHQINRVSPIEVSREPDFLDQDFRGGPQTETLQMNNDVVPSLTNIVFPPPKSSEVHELPGAGGLGTEHGYNRHYARYDAQITGEVLRRRSPPVTTQSTPTTTTTTSTTPPTTPTSTPQGTGLLGRITRAARTLGSGRMTGGLLRNRGLLGRARGGTPRR